jgi:outer membrane murein-binding lipoprotein Lpp
MNHHPVMDDRPVSRGSKQKIMKLKEELTNTKTHTIDPQIFRIRQLKESYDLSLLKMNEMNNSAVHSTSNLYVKIHGKRASKAYSALSSIIYASIAAAKIDSLEAFIRQTIASLPANMIDLEEWNHILNLSRETREASLLSSPSAGLALSSLSPQQQQQFSPDFLKKFQLLYFLATNPIRNTKDELIVFKKSVIDELSSYQSYYLSTLEMISQVLMKLRNHSSGDYNIKKITSLQQQVSDLNKQLKQVRADSDDAIRQQVEAYKQQYQEEFQQMATQASSHGNNPQDLRKLQAELQKQQEQHHKQLEIMQKAVDSLEVEKKQAVKEKETLSSSYENAMRSLENAGKELAAVEQSSSSFTNDKKEPINLISASLTRDVVDHCVSNFDTIEKMKDDHSKEMEELKAVVSSLKKENEELKKNAASAPSSSSEVAPSPITPSVSAAIVAKKDDYIHELESLLKQAENAYENEKTKTTQLEKEKISFSEKYELLSMNCDEFANKTQSVIQSLVNAAETEKNSSKRFSETIEQLEKDLLTTSQQLTNSEEEFVKYQKQQDEQILTMLEEKQLEIVTLTEKLDFLIRDDTNGASNEGESGGDGSSSEEKLSKLEKKYELLSKEKKLLEMEKEELIRTNERNHTSTESMKELLLHNQQLEKEISHCKIENYNSIKDDIATSYEMKLDDYVRLEKELASCMSVLSRADYDELLFSVSSSKLELSNLFNEITNYPEIISESSIIMNTFQHWKNELIKKNNNLLFLYEKLYEKKSAYSVTTATAVPVAVNPSPEQQQHMRQLEKENNILKDKNEFLVQTKQDNELTIKDLREEMNRVINELLDLKDANKQLQSSIYLLPQSTETLESSLGSKTGIRSVGFAETPEVFVFKQAKSETSIGTVSDDSLDGLENTPGWGMGSLEGPKDEKTDPSTAVASEEVKVENEKGDDNQTPTNFSPAFIQASTVIPSAAMTPLSSSASSYPQPGTLFKEGSSSSLQKDSSDLPRNSAYYEAQRLVLDAIKTGIMSFKDSDKPIGGSGNTGSVGSVGSLSPRSISSLENKKNSFIVAPVVNETTASSSVKAGLSEPAGSSVKEESEKETKELKQANTVSEPSEEYPAREKSKLKRSFVNPFSQVDMDDPFTRSAVRIQSTIRSYTARARVRRIQMERKAASQGILVACYGTQQGETGWYTTQQQLFYFCAQEVRIVFSAFLFFMIFCCFSRLFGFFSFFPGAFC